MFFDSEKAADDIERGLRRRCTVVVDPASAAVPRRRVARLQGRPPGRRVHDQQPERAAHLRLRPVVLVSDPSHFAGLRTTSASSSACCISSWPNAPSRRAVIVPVGIDAEQPRLAREVPRGDGRRRVVRCGGSCRCRRARCRRGPGSRRRAAAGCRAPARSTATGSAPGVANNTATGLPLPMTCRATWCAAGTSDRACRSGRRRAGSPASATRRVGAAAPTVGASALRLHLEHERQLLAVRDPRRRPRCLPCRRRVSATYTPRRSAADRPRSSVVSHERRSASFPCGRDRDRTPTAGGEPFLRRASRTRSAAACSRRTGRSTAPIG